MCSWSPQEHCENCFWYLPRQAGKYLHATCILAGWPCTFSFLLTRRPHASPHRAQRPRSRGTPARREAGRRPCPAVLCAAPRSFYWLPTVWYGLDWTTSSPRPRANPAPSAEAAFIRSPLTSQIINDTSHPPPAMYPNRLPPALSPLDGLALHPDTQG